MVEALNSPSPCPTPTHLPPLDLEDASGFMGPLLSYSAYLLGVRGVRGLLIRPKVGVEAGSLGGWGGQPPKTWESES